VRALRRVVLPERVDQAVGGDDTVRVQEQHGQQGALLCAARVERLSAGNDFQRAENPELHPPLPCDRDLGDLNGSRRIRLGTRLNRALTDP
jgi:hypothetical protein